MRGCVRRGSRRRSRSQHHPAPSAGPAFACPAAAAAAAGSAPATVAPTQLPSHGQASLCGRLLLLFQLLLLLPLPSRSSKPLPQLTLAQRHAVSPAQLARAARAPPTRRTHRLVSDLWPSCIALRTVAPATSSLPPEGPAAPQPPPGAAPSRLCRAVASPLHVGPRPAPAAPGGRC